MHLPILNFVNLRDFVTFPKSRDKRWHIDIQPLRHKDAKFHKEYNVSMRRSTYCKPINRLLSLSKIFRDKRANNNNRKPGILQTYSAHHRKAKAATRNAQRKSCTHLSKR